MLKINQAIVESIPVPLSPLDTQCQIVAELETERALVEANWKLIELFERKMQDKLAEIWGSAADGASDA
jgi:type I restriction enzyme M protein